MQKYDINGPIDPAVFDQYFTMIGVKPPEAMQREVDATRYEIARLQRLIPQESTGCWSKYGGECLSCGNQRVPTTKHSPDTSVNTDNDSIEGLNIGV